MIKVTTPQEAIHSDMHHLDAVVTLFEKRLKFHIDESNGTSENFYLVIVAVHSEELCREVEKIYKAAGWRSAVCKVTGNKYLTLTLSQKGFYRAKDGTIFKECVGLSGNKCFYYVADDDKNKTYITEESVKTLCGGVWIAED